MSAAMRYVLKTDPDIGKRTADYFTRSASGLTKSDLRTPQNAGLTRRPRTTENAGDTDTAHWAAQALLPPVTRRIRRARHARPIFS
jgi:hypothetical protein